MNVSELLTLFKSKPYTVKYSANRLSQRFKCTVEDAVEAKKILLLNSSNSTNKEHHITPKTIIKEIREVVSNEIKDDSGKEKTKMSKKDKDSLMQSIETQMNEAAKNLDFERAMELRDILFEMKSNK